MKIRSYPPVGQPISFRRNPEVSAVDELFQGLNQRWVSSGTSALALALLDIQNKSADPNKKEVIIPGYCCPDLVSAVNYAGFKARPVDLAYDDTCYAKQDLTSALSSQTVAVIAINFLGMPEPINVLRSLVEPYGVPIIEDNAQWFPMNPSEYSMQGDYATFSFGRGKALNLLGGGLALCCREWAVPEPAEQAVLTEALIWQIKGRLLNVLTLPAVYRWLEMLPFLGLGRTEYHVLTELASFPAFKKPYLSANLQQYSGLSREVEAIYRRRLSGSLLSHRLAQQDERLLRFPLLFANRRARDEAHRRLQSSGLGSSCFYAKALLDIDGLPQPSMLAASTPNAKDFAQRFLTLPTHPRMKPEHAHQICDQLLDLMG
ncbi:DegT/DnrJ/EryC1/StrS family aminotransferase [Reinekea blandensis]|uniref:Predicted pyridoxal phosphate-dependent enzyme n=1 Tax=Reinekea blandensis MED297 TaxID=314283 RepID=A4B935_9GAMM|nr:DegT/DnrJ/EryC1/StrS family aminotransferase [Reinekea blandensis]EAR11136.1 predicted pyridoxal phosphate-dependent enzyme [Reinekea sp. MED297] [Reinekea blandensis MED297]